MKWFILVLAIVAVSAVHVRKNQINMSDDEIQRFVDAVLTLKYNGIYDQFVRVHELTFVSRREKTSVQLECLLNNGDQSKPQW
jgi:hypothetical protein